MLGVTTVHQVLATLGYGDAIGNEVLGIQRILRAAGHTSDIFVETADPRVEDRTRDFRELLQIADPETILIHHFSIGSKASRVAYALPGRMILVYHNITPPEYFIGVHPLLVHQCYRGRRELQAYVSRCTLALGDSEFNRAELESIGFPHTDVLPVVPDFSHLEVAPDRLVAHEFDDDWTNVLFVGRIIPNKRIEDLIRCFYTYCRHFNPRSRLLIVGSYAGFEGYLATLHRLVRTLGLSDVHLVGQVSNEELTAYYDVGDLYLCASEHEGFCVPLIEAFFKRLPVLAYASTAVPATMNGGGVLYDTKDPAHVAALMDAILSDRELEDRILDGQDRALRRLRDMDFAGRLLEFVERARVDPTERAPAVAYDFWQQFELAEHLEELRVYRPALYQALPPAPTPMDTPSADAEPDVGPRRDGSTGS